MDMNLELDGVYRCTLNGLPLQSGDILCTQDGGDDLPIGAFWHLLGLLAPGEVDHVAVYTGPGGRCVESGPLGIHTFELNGERWDSAALMAQRGPFVDTLVGIAYPLEGRGFSTAQEEQIRLEVGRFCLEQVRLGKPYNFNLLNPDIHDAFYCSQLPYCAYLPYGINLNTGLGVPNLPGSSSIVFPQEIWSGCVHRRA
jgi:uncharacterized protein YycO